MGIAVQLYSVFNIGARWAEGLGVGQCYNHSPSSSVGSHVLIPRNLSVLSSTKIISYINLHFKYSLSYFTKLLRFTDVCLWMRR
jgi:hypothetical protein